MRLTVFEPVDKCFIGGLINLINSMQQVNNIRLVMSPAGVCS